MIRIKLKNVSILFEIEHEKIGSLKEKFVTTVKRKNTPKGKIWALNNISFEARDGDCIGVIGENASGKTTLLKTIGSILKPTKGEVSVNGKVATLLTLGLGFDPELTAKDNVYLYSSIMGLTKQDIDLKYKNIVDFSELEEFMDVKLKNFSDGMKVRLGFATAINVDADILLIDEVLAVGDGAFQKKCLSKIEELKTLGKTIIFVSHGLQTINKYSDKVVFLQRGEMREFGEPEKVVESYETYLENKELNAYNSVKLEQIKNQGIIDVRFYKNDQEFWIFNTGDAFKAFVKFRLKNKPSIFCLSFINESEIRFYSKKMKDKLVEFDVNSLPLREGRYRVFINNKEIEMFSGFEVAVKMGKTRGDTRLFSENLSLEKKVYAFGKNCEDIFKNFEKGETLVVFPNMEEASKNSENGVIFNDKKILFKGKTKEVVDRYKEEFCKEFIEKYGEEFKTK